MLRLAAVAVFLGGQLGALAHNAFVQHRVCAEHGEQEHAGEHGTEAFAADHEATDHSVVFAAGEPSEDHGHCAVESITREPAGETPSVTIAAVVAWDNASAPQTDEIATTGQLIYRLAPKQSPPA
jgi:hypothetical protein